MIQGNIGSSTYSASQINLVSGELDGIALQCTAISSSNSCAIGGNIHCAASYAASNIDTLAVASTFTKNGNVASTVGAAGIYGTGNGNTV